MLETLVAVDKRTAEFNKYLGSANERQLKLELAYLPAGAPPVERMKLLAMLADAELMLGKTAEAIKHYEQAAVIFSQVRDSLDVELQEFFQFQYAVAYLRLAENENCVHCRNGESCIIPIRGEGVHQFTSGATKSIEQLILLLKRR